ncbi:1-(5-phosphoribosyl)-5-((5-phosphoribosylamino)methylideneamino)imidazole-4-carboxamide isomerase [Betaproteobacteria bacterium GR16-43]|nr:1-(5-phosphoribosyl)-5-((5-phosphoribosylamino)methylideneamino)imidazole-4-carboxamide isomerase [Betaproteobacteria bacterium GR16-43]
MDRKTPTPTEIKLHQVSKNLEVTFNDGRTFELPVEYLRVFSPSAEVRGHGPGQEVLQTGKRDVNITAIDPIGAYAVKFVFSDGHDTGIYSWEYLYDLGAMRESNWKSYLARLEQAGASRDVETPAPGGHVHGPGCSHH